MVLFTNPDPAFLVNEDPDPALKMIANPEPDKKLPLPNIFKNQRKRLFIKKSKVTF
jgi:hypothetical protein